MDNKPELSRYQKNRLADAAQNYHKDHRCYNKDSNIEFVITIALVVILVFSFRLLVFEPTRVVGGSMTPTLVNGERMFVEKFSYWFSDPNRGDIIICYYPDEYRRENNATYVKRVIGLPGETIEVTDGQVFITDKNGTRYQLDETEYWGQRMFDDYPPREIPEGYVFVMGDNRNNSGDSRLGSVGPIPLQRIVGRVHGVVWPIANIRDVDGVTYPSQG